MIRYIFILFVCLKGFSQAQTVDSIKQALSGKRLIDFSYGSKNAFISKQLVSIQSIKLGVSFDKKISIGAGYSWLTTKIMDTKTFHDNYSNENISVQRRLSLGYVGLYAEYTYFTSRRWEFSVPMQFGIGKIGYTYVYQGKKMTDDKGYCFVYEPEIDVKFKVLRWVGLEADVGYRILIQNDPLAKKTFNSPLFSFGAFISWDEVFLILFPKNKWVQNKFGPSDWN